MADTLTSFSEQLAATVDKAAQSVVAVHARSRFDSSGVHWSPGIIVTADHTVRRDEDISVVVPNGSSFAAELVGRDPGTDLAVLRVIGLEAPVAPRSAKPLVQPGQLVLAVGRSKDSPIAAFGVISSLSGPSQTWRGGKLDQVVRLDLELHPGGSGGAVVDASGELLGIATSALSRFSVFAIPLSTVDRVVSSLVAHGRIRRGYLGVGLQPIAIPEHLKSKLNLTSSCGLIAVSVDAEAPAGRAGVLIGDVLVELGGRTIQKPENVQEVLDTDSIGKAIPAKIVRAGNLVTVDVTVAERPKRG